MSRLQTSSGFWLDSFPSTFGPSIQDLYLFSAFLSVVIANSFHLRKLDNHVRVVAGSRVLGDVGNLWRSPLERIALLHPQLEIVKDVHPRMAVDPHRPGDSGSRHQPKLIRVVNHKLIRLSYPHR